MTHSVNSYKGQTMKRIISLIIAFIMIAAVFSSCGKGGDGDVTGEETGKTFSAGDYSIVMPDGADVSLRWESSDPSVVAVDKNGRLTALKDGYSIISTPLVSMFRSMFG